MRRDEVVDAIEAFAKDGYQAVTVAMLGERCDLCVMALGPDLHRLRGLQTDLQRTGLIVRDSYLSLTEISEYAAGLPEAMREARLHPVLPPADMPAFCFYPMSKRRIPDTANWYELDYEARLQLMAGHGRTGRNYRGRVVQLITGSTGLDDYEWGVTLFATDFEQLKSCVYEMRFDPASARYAEFGPFVTGLVGEPSYVLDAIGLGRAEP